MVQAEVFFLSSSRRSALEPEVKFTFRFTFKLGLGAAAEEWGKEGLGDGRWEMGDRGRASALARKGWATASRPVGPGRRRRRPAGSQAFFLPERRRS